MNFMKNDTIKSIQRIGCLKERNSMTAKIDTCMGFDHWAVSFWDLLYYFSLKAQVNSGLNQCNGCFIIYLPSSLKEIIFPLGVFSVPKLILKWNVQPQI